MLYASEIVISDIPEEESVPEREKFWFCEVDFPSLDSRAETAAGRRSPWGTA